MCLHKIVYIIKYKIVIMFIIICCLLGLNVNNKMNDTKYTPKSKQSRIFIWLRKLINGVCQNINNADQNVSRKAKIDDL